MNLVPVVLERWIVAGLLLIPAGALLSLLALEGQAGRLTAAVAVVSACLYAAISLLAVRRDLRSQVAGAAPADPDARMEPLGITASRALPRVAVAIAICALASAADVLILGVGLVMGGGAVSALAALQLQSAERRDQIRLVRPGGALWQPARPLQRL